VRYHVPGQSVGDSAALRPMEDDGGYGGGRVGEVGPYQDKIGGGDAV
jgi:hypothetical protein